MEKLKKPGKFITKTQFRNFLKKEVKRNAKYKCETDNCPLSAASGYAVGGGLFTHYPDLMEYVAIDSVVLEDIGVAKPLPLWATFFIDKWDTLTEDQGGSAVLALSLLENN